MVTDLPLSTRQAYSEVDSFLKLLNNECINKVPKKLRDLFKEEKDVNYIKEIDSTKPIIEQNLMKETLALIALLNLEYWCTDEAEKERLKQIYSENERKYQEELKEKYNPDNLFINNQVKDIIQKETSNNENMLIEYKESIFKKFIDKLKNLFHIKIKENK